MHERLLRLPDVSERTGLSRTRINELEGEGRFPTRRRISDRAIGWFESEISAWVESRPVAKCSAPVPVREP